MRCRARNHCAALFCLPIGAAGSTCHARRIAIVRGARGPLEPRAGAARDRRSQSARRAASACRRRSDRNARKSAQKPPSASTMTVPGPTYRARRGSRERVAANRTVGKSTPDPRERYGDFVAALVARRADVTAHVVPFDRGLATRRDEVQRIFPEVAIEDVGAPGRSQPRRRQPQIHRGCPYDVGRSVYIATGPARGEMGGARIAPVSSISVGRAYRRRRHAAVGSYEQAAHPLAPVAPAAPSVNAMVRGSVIALFINRAVIRGVCHRRIAENLSHQSSVFSALHRIHGYCLVAAILCLREQHPARTWNGRRGPSASRRTIRISISAEQSPRCRHFRCLAWCSW